MSTRGLYKFGDYKVYKHWDNYPTGAHEFIKNAMSLAWRLPRFEPEEFSTAFIAANKKGSGDIYMIGRHAQMDDCGAEYLYEISLDGSGVDLFVKISDESGCIFTGTLTEMGEKYGKVD
jgi:hypothetical protein